MKNKNSPIGYWIKQADELLTKGINEIQASLELTRTEWQVLNSIHENILLSKTDLTNVMKPFADDNMIESILARFHTDDIIKTQHGKVFTLTENGQKLHKLCFEQQQLFRQKAMIGISQQDYQTTVSTLQKMAENINRIEE